LAPHFFNAQVLACLPPEDYKITLEGAPERLDLRHLPVLSIDPPGCKDIDDALHCTVLPNGNYQVGVHIADVTHYVKANTPIDLEAAYRSTSTYLVNKRLDMLPKLLTTDLCSLKGNVDRYVNTYMNRIMREYLLLLLLFWCLVLDKDIIEWSNLSLTPHVSFCLFFSFLRFAFSVLWEVTPDADIVDVEFKKSIIHSIGALTYQQAQTLIDTPDGKADDEIKAGAVKRLNSLAKKFRAKRLDAGALTLASPEVKFVLDSESLNPTDVQAYPLYEANALVEEFMLLANVTVGKKILRNYPTLSILRRHPAPSRTMFDSLIKKAKLKGFDINIDDSKMLAESLDAAELPEDAYFNKLLRILSTRCMSPAQYFCSGDHKPSEWHHYGLAAPVYTHFTSPIRRYADVCVHRLLAASIGVAPLPPRLSSKTILHDLAANMNRRHRAAQLAGRASVQLHTVLFFASASEEQKEAGGKSKGKTIEEDAYVLDVEASETSNPSITVFVPRYGIEGRIKLGTTSNNDDDAHDANNDKQISLSSTWECNPNDFSVYHKDESGDASKDVRIQVFDKVRVSIWVRALADYQNELVVDLVEPRLKGLLGAETPQKGQEAGGKKRQGGKEAESPASGSAKKQKRKKKGGKKK
jgi:exosome complex exonuclease DIS3/RRP44